MSASIAMGGAHCDEAGCHQLDFLPFTCDHCHRTFCLDHRDPSHHTCNFDVTQQRQMPTCPVCSQRIFVQSTQSPDGVVNAHILSGCRLHLMKDVEVSVKKRQSAALRCDLVDGCANRESYSTVLCKKCGLQFCLTHRFPENHKCTKRQTLTAHSSRLSPLLPSSLSPSHSALGPAVSASSSSPAAVGKHAKGKALLEKVRREREEKAASKPSLPAPAPRKPPAPQRHAQTTTLQQLRAQMSSVTSYIAETLTGPAHPSPSPSPPPPTAGPPPTPSPAIRKAARGDDRVPVDERWYLYVDASAVRRSAKEAVVVWVNRQWTVGRAIDAVCEAVGVECQNHLAEGKKIGLGCERTMKGGVLLPTDLPLHLLAPAVMNGDTVQLRYREAVSPIPGAAPPSSGS